MLEGRSALRWSWWLLLLAASLPACAHRHEPPSETLTWEVPGEDQVLLAGGETPTVAPTLGASALDEARYTPLEASRVLDLCRDPLLARVRPLVPEVPLCAKGVPAHYATVQHGAHQALVVAWRDERPSWVDGPVVYGQAALVDGKRWPEASDVPFFGSLAPLVDLSDSEAWALLRAALLEGGVFEQVVRVDEAREALRGWPEAVAFVEAHPPGTRSDADGRHLRLYGVGREVERGVQCTHLAQHVATLTRDGVVVLRPGRAWATGQRLGRPCGEPLPAP